MRILPLLVLLGILQLITALPEGFSYINEIDPTIIISARYASANNFRGQPVEGYKKPIAIASTPLANALKHAQDIVRDLGYSLVVYDAYRPQKAVNDLVQWTNLPQTNKTKPSYYPFISKEDIIPGGYLAPRSGHTRGSRVDLSLIRLNKNITEIKYIPYSLKNGRSFLMMDDGTEHMGGHFDLFDQSSHHDTLLIDDKATKNRNLLRGVMRAVGLEELHQEWWHYALKYEPFPATYFDFDVE